MTAIDRNSFDFGDSTTLPALKSSADYIVAQRNIAIGLITEAATELDKAYATVKRAVATAKLVTDTEAYSYEYAHSSNRNYKILFNDRYNPESAIEAFRKTIDADIWNTLLNRSGLRDLMDMEARKAFNTQLADTVPEVSVENLRATMEVLYGDRERMFLRGLANVFGKLDRRFKSHDAFKVGGRIILDRICGFSGGFSRHGGGADLLNDMDRVLRKLVGKDECPGFLVAQLDRLQGRSYGPKQIFFENDYVKIRIFLNGNAHLYISEPARELVNKALAKYYGDVVPDAAPRGEDSASFQMRSANLPAKDFAFYATPDAAAESLLHDIGLRKGMRILEPSAGHGALLTALRKKVAEYAKIDREEIRVTRADLTIDAIEIHPARCEVLRATQGDFCNVIEGNFLDRQPVEIYDLILGNPPFHGTHYMDHVKMAYSMLKNGGRMRFILPVTAVIGSTARHAQFHRWLDGCGSYNWSDLPAESFAESGTMINTTILSIWKHSR